MLQLKLQGVNAVLENKNDRTEKHGDIDEPALTLKFSAALPATTLLPSFSPDLFAQMFTKTQDLGGDVLAIRDTHIVYPMKRTEEMSGATLEIDSSVDPEKPMKITGCTIDGFSLEPMEGGTVILKFNVGFVGHGEHSQWLYEHQKQEMVIKITPAELPDMGAANEEEDDDRDAA